MLTPPVLLFPPPFVAAQTETCVKISDSLVFSLLIRAD